MINIRHNTADHYWIVGGSGPQLATHSDHFTKHTQVYSSRFDHYVPIDDKTYAKWRIDAIARYGFDPTTRIDTELNLIEVLKTAGVKCSLKIEDGKKK